MRPSAGDYAFQVGVRMRLVREARGLSLDDVETASRGQFNAAVLGTWERADRAISVEKLAEYAQWLGISIRKLLPPQKGEREWRQAAAAEIADKALQSVSATIASLTPAEANSLLVSALREREAS